VTQLLRQGDAKVFKKYSQMKLQMKREALQKLNRQANDTATRTKTTKNRPNRVKTVPKPHQFGLSASKLRLLSTSTRFPTNCFYSWWNAGSEMFKSCA